MTAAVILCSYRSPIRAQGGRHGCSHSASYMDADGLMWCADHAAGRCAEHVMTPMEAMTVT